VNELTRSSTPCAPPDELKRRVKIPAPSPSCPLPCQAITKSPFAVALTVGKRWLPTV
jgi:hypothetical protein